MRLTVKAKLSLYIGLILLVTAAVGAISYSLTQSIDERVRVLTEIDEPTSAAAFEMEISAIGTGLGVLKYLDTGDPVFRESGANSQADFERSYELYVKLAKTTQEMELGTELSLLYEDYRALGESLMNRKDDEDALFATVAENFEQMDVIIDEELQAGVDLNGPDGFQKSLVSAQMEADLAEVGTWLGNYLRTREDRYRERIADDSADFEQALAEFQRLALTQEERAQATTLGSTFIATSALIDEVITHDTELQIGIREFIELRSQIDNILGDEIQALTTAELEEAKDAVHAAVSRIDTVIVVGVIGSIVIAVLAGFVVLRSITRPIRQLVKATRAIGGG